MFAVGQAMPWIYRNTLRFVNSTWLPTLKWECYVDDISVTGCTGSCQNRDHHSRLRLKSQLPVHSMMKISERETFPFQYKLLDDFYFQSVFTCLYMVLRPTLSPNLWPVDQCWPWLIVNSVLLSHSCPRRLLLSDCLFSYRSAQQMGRRWNVPVWTRKHTRSTQ